MSPLILKRASASRSSGQWRDDDYDVLENGVVVGRIFCVDAEWIAFIVAVVLLWLLMIVAITELELVAVPDQWRLNLAKHTSALA